MLRAAITSLHEHILFENSYPELQQRRKLMADVLMSCTKDGEDFDAVRNRLAKDSKYVRVLSTVVRSGYVLFHIADCTLTCITA